METKPNDFKLGVFVIASFGLLAAGIFAFGALSYLQKTTLAETYVPGNVAGLSVGAPVDLRGVRVGKVTRIEFSWNVYPQAGPRYVVIEFEIRNGVAPMSSDKAIAERIQTQIKQGLRARVNPQGFTGSSLLSLEYVDPAEYPPVPVPWTPEHIYIPSAPGQFGEVLASLQKTLHNTAQLDLQALGGSLQRDLAAAEKLLDRLERDLDPAEKLMGHLERDLSSAETLIAELNEVHFRELAASAQTLITQLHTDVSEMHLGNLSHNADELLTDVKGTVGRLDSVVANLDTASLNDALANIRLASRSLDETLRKLKQYPSGFLLGKPPPLASSLEKSKE
jgi:phospholipid/cholesterol/gamma-HCH transport system substrate-binding protein